MSNSSEEHFAHSVALGYLPLAEHWLQEADDASLVILGVSSLLTILVLLLAIVHIYYIHCYVYSERVQCDLFFLAFFFPVLSLCAVGGMYSPRSSQFLYAFSTTYLMVCLCMGISLMKDVLGGTSAISSYLTLKGQPLTLTTRDACSRACGCWPTFAPTEKNLWRIESLVVQSPIVRAILEVISTVLFLELKDTKSVKLAVDIAKIVSFCTAIYAGAILLHSVADVIEKYRLYAICRLVGVTQLMMTVQKMVLDNAADSLPVPPLFGSLSLTQALFWNGFAVVVEACGLCCLATFLLRPTRCALFAATGGRRPSKPNTNSTTTFESVAA